MRSHGGKLKVAKLRREVVDSDEQNNDPRGMDERSPGSPTLVVSKSVDRGDDSKECRGVSFSETGTLPRKHHQMNIAINTQRLSTRTNSTRASLSSCVDNAPPPPSPQVTVTPRRVKNLVRNIVASPGRKKRDEGDGSGSPSRARPLNGSRVIRAKSFASANRQHDARAAGGSLQRQGSQSPDRQALPSHITSASIEHAIAASQAGTTLSDAPHTAWPSNDGSVPILPLSALSTFRDKPYWGDAGSGGAPPPQQQQQQQGASSSCAFSAHSSENESLLSDEAERPQGSFSSWFLRSDVRLATKVYLALLPAGVSFALVTVLVFVSVGVTELFAVLCCVAAFVGIVTVMLARHLVIATVVSDYDIAERIRPSKEMYAQYPVSKTPLFCVNNALLVLKISSWQRTKSNSPNQVKSR
ncbi:hypothetical protein DIPPA_12207 [Diplonema papillatum]|nr:hypothetical protein DIPPA_12207 [Diplonema papillatum]